MTGVQTCALPISFAEIRENLRMSFQVPLPPGAAGPEYDDAAHRAAFLAFLKFIKSNLAGQTNLRVDPAWASQNAIMQGFAGFVTPDLILREATLAQDIKGLIAQIGLQDGPTLGPTDPHLERLTRIYDGDIETATRDAYARDYMAFGFADWA